MRLTELKPRWWLADSQDVTAFDLAADDPSAEHLNHIMVPRDLRVVGVSFACPIHARDGLDEDGDSQCTLARIYVAFTNPPKGPRYRYHPVTWERWGETFDDLVLRVSIRCNGFHWHGYVGGFPGQDQPGEVVTCPDTKGVDG